MNLTLSYYDLPKVEKEITELYAVGLTKKEIAVMRGRSVHTVDNQLKSIFLKTGTRKDTELAAWYFCTRYKLTLDLPDAARKMLAVCMLAILGIGMMNEQNIRSTGRIVRTARSGRRNERGINFYL